MNVAFFDLDHTLLRVNSGKLWVEYQYREGQLSRTDLLKTFGYLLGYRLAIVDVERVARSAVERIAGVAEERLRQEVWTWYDAEVRAHMNPILLEKVAEHRAQQHRVVLLTASSPYVSERAVEQAGLDDFLCTRFAVDDGKFTGELEGPFCYGTGKVAWAQTWMAQHGGSLKDAWFYTDSYTDLPMLEAVAHPVVVNPDPRLRRWAARTGVPTILAP